MAMGLHSGNLSSEMNITPFIDVLLVLLVIFMVSVKVRQVMYAQLAQQHLSGERAIERPLVLELRNDGTYALNQQVVAKAELGNYLFRVFRGRDESILFVRVGGQRPYRELVETLDVAKGAGVQVLAFAP